MFSKLMLFKMTTTTPYVSFNCCIISYHITFYNMNAASPARIAPVLTIICTAPPSYEPDWAGLAPPPRVLLGITLPLPPVLWPTVPLPAVPLPAVPPTRVKLAQVKRVELLAWMTIDRLPKKDAGPFSVER